MRALSLTSSHRIIEKTREGQRGEIDICKVWLCITLKDQTDMHKRGEGHRKDSFAL